MFEWGVNVTVFIKLYEKVNVGNNIYIDYAHIYEYH